MLFRSAIIDTANNKQYVIVTEQGGELVSSSVADLTATGFTGANFYAGATEATIDNLKVEQKAADVSLVTVAVKDGGNGLEGAEVTIGALTGTTDANGNAVFALPYGTYEVNATKSGYEHTTGQDDAATENVIINTETHDVTLTLSQKSYVKEVNVVTVEGGQVYIAAPKVAEPAKATAFTVSVMDQMNAPMTAGEDRKSVV